MTNENRPSGLDRALRLFTDVHAGEGVHALLLSLNIFLILTAYYILKPVREALILGGGSAELKSYISAGQVLLLAFLVPWYGRLAARFLRRRLINLVTAFFVGCLVVFYFLAQLGVPLGVAFFIWVGIFNLMIPSQFWAFANDIYTKDEGERLFPIVQFGASLGAVLGAGIAALFMAPLGVYQLMLLASVVLVAQLLVTNHLDRKERERTETELPDAETTAVMPAATTQIREATGTLSVSLGEAHASGLVHRDVKPANIYLCRYGRAVDFVKILDFGMVKEELGEAGLTQVGTFAGTPHYAAPEMAEGFLDEIDARSDVYALGGVAYWLLTGRTVFEGETAMKILMKHVSEEPDAPSKFADGISPALDRVVLDCLAKNRDERPSSTDRLDEILAAVEGAHDWTEDLARRWWEEHRPVKRHKDVEAHAKSKGSRGNGDVRRSP